MLKYEYENATVYITKPTEKHIENIRKATEVFSPKRNMEMAKVGDYVICFWDGKSKGTKIMIDYAKQFNKPLKIKEI